MGNLRTQKIIKIEMINGGGNYTGYPGAFPNNVEKIISTAVAGKVLHLYSGRSVIGTERIDLLRPEATKNIDVFDFIAQNTDPWDWVIADPPYAIKSAPDKLKIYGDLRPFTGNVPYERKMADFLQKHAKNVIWFDLCSPTFGLATDKIIFVRFNNFRPVRALTFLKNEKIF